MKSVSWRFLVFGCCFINLVGFLAASDPEANVQKVARMNGLVAFWDFQHTEGDTWASYFDDETVDRSFPLHLRRIGDENNYTNQNWPYADADSRVILNHRGPFGHAVRFNKGYIYGLVERRDFEDTVLNIHGRQAFTLIAWVKFIGKRHLVAGIWDEGGWDRYEGRRQVALFAGLFRQKGVIAHISATGAASFPQSTIPGSQYARVRAIDGQPFEDDQWVCVAMTFDLAKQEVVAYLNGEMIFYKLTDPVEDDVFAYQEEQVANPLPFTFPIFSPKSFLLKFNGYNYREDPIQEHRLWVDLTNSQLTYEQEPVPQTSKTQFRISVDILRRGKSLLSDPISIKGLHGETMAIPSELQFQNGDQVVAKLESMVDGNWQAVGTDVRRVLRPGAPFTVGRALGLGAEEIEHGSQLYCDGVAVFNRVLGGDELKRLNFGL